MRSMLVAATSLLGMMSLAGTAAAAPQVLLVVTPKDEMPLVCEGGHCSTEVTAICLQPDRANPERGSHYSVVPDSSGSDRMTLVGRTADGREMTLPTEKYLAVTAERDHLAVKLSVTDSVMKEHGLTDLMVRLAGNVVLMPHETAGDATPQTESDLALAQTTLRKTAEGVLARRGDHIDGAKMVRTALNVLPRDRVTTAEERAAARAEAMRIDASEAAKAHASDAFDSCASVGDGAINKLYEYRYSYRSCLGLMHDRMIDTVNQEYWDVLKAGS